MLYSDLTYTQQQPSWLPAGLSLTTELPAVTPKRVEVEQALTHEQPNSYPVQPELSAVGGKPCYSCSVGSKHSKISAVPRRPRLSTPDAHGPQSLSSVKHRSQGSVGIWSGELCRIHRLFSTTSCKSDLALLLLSSQNKKYKALSPQLCSHVRWDKDFAPAAAFSPCMCSTATESAQMIKRMELNRSQ